MERQSINPSTLIKAKAILDTHCSRFIICVLILLTSFLPHITSLPPASPKTIISWVQAFHRAGKECGYGSGGLRCLQTWQIGLFSGLILNLEKWTSHISSFVHLVFYSVHRLLPVQAGSVWRWLQQQHGWTRTRTSCTKISINPYLLQTFHWNWNWQELISDDTICGESFSVLFNLDIQSFG